MRNDNRDQNVGGEMVKTDNVGGPQNSKLFLYSKPCSNQSMRETNN